jgi:hypothetical protein
MFTKSFILFLFIFSMNKATRESQVVEGMFNSLKKDIFEPKECYPKLLDFYLENEGPSKSFIAGDNIHDLCPNIKQSCCSYEQLVEIHTQAKNAYEQTLKFIDVLKNVTNQIADLSDERKAAIIKKVQETDSEWKDDNGHSFTKSLEYFKEKRDQINESFEIGMKNYSLANANYACAMCDQASHDSIIVKRKQYPKIQIDTKQCKKFFGSPEIYHHVALYANIKQLYIVYGSILESEENSRLKGDVKDLIFPENIEKFAKHYQDCAKGDTLQKSEECLHACKETGLFNENVFAQFMESIVIFQIAGTAILEEKPIKTEEHAQEFEKLFKEIGQYFWVQPKKAKTRIERFEKIYTYGTGWNNMNHNFVVADAFLEVDEQGKKTIILREGLGRVSILSLILTVWLYIR